MHGHPQSRCQRNGSSGLTGIPIHHRYRRLVRGAGEAALHPDARRWLRVIKRRATGGTCNDGELGLVCFDTARIGLACVDDLSAEVPGLRCVQTPNHQARSWNDLTRLGTTATTQSSLALSHVSKASEDLRDFVGAISKHRIAIDSASGPGDTEFLQLSVRLKHSPCPQHRPPTRPPDVITGEQSAEPSLTKKANTLLRAHADTPSPPDITR